MNKPVVTGYLPHQPGVAAVVHLHGESLLSSEWTKLLTLGAETLSKLPFIHHPLISN